MKRTALIKKSNEGGCELVRPGARHDGYRIPRRRFLSPNRPIAISAAASRSTSWRSWVAARRGRFWQGREKTLRSEAAGEALAPTLCSWFTQQLPAEEICDLFNVRGTPLPGANGWLVRVSADRARQAALLPDAVERLPAVISRAVERWD